MATPVEYSNTELTERVKQLESIILDLMGQQTRYKSTAYIRTICVNTSLHSRSVYTPPEDMKYHPSTLLVPHYEWQPYIDWEKDIIHLHPENEPR